MAEISQNDRKILRELQRDATISMKDLADRVAMSPSTAWRRVQDLEAAGVIKERVTLIDPNSLDLSVCVLINVNIKEHRGGMRSAFESFVAGHMSILQCFAVTGSHDYTLVVRTISVEAYEHFLMEDLLMHPSVASAETHLVLRQHKNATTLPF